MGLVLFSSFLQIITLSVLFLKCRSDPAPPGLNPLLVPIVFGTKSKLLPRASSSLCSPASATLSSDAPCSSQTQVFLTLVFLLPFPLAWEAPRVLAHLILSGEAPP